MSSSSIHSHSSLITVIIIAALTLCVLPAAHALYSPSDNVVDLTSANFNSKVINSNDIVLVEFFAPWCGHCKSLVPEYKKVAQALSGVVVVGAVDGTANENLAGQYGIKGFPTIKLFIGNKAKPVDYEGQRTAQAIAEWVVAQVKSEVSRRLSGGGSSKSSGSSGSGSKSGGGKVIQLSESDFESSVLQSDDLWLVEFFAPWCGHCKNLAPHWEKAAAELGGVAKLGAVDATVHTSLASKYGIKGYPTIKVFKPGKKTSPEDYQGGRTSSDIVQYTKNMAETVVPAKPKPVVQLIDQSSLEPCNEHTCIIAFLPHILDSGAKGRNEYLSTLQQVATTNAKKPFSYLWTEAGAQAKAETLLSSGEGIAFYPAVAAYNGKKGRATMMRGAFHADGIGLFMTGLATGTEKTIPVAALTAEKSEKWDGKDGQLPPSSSDDL